MSNSIAIAHVGTKPSSELATILRALDAVVASTDPTEVLASLISACVPLVCDTAAATVYVADQPVFSVGSAATGGPCEAEYAFTESLLRIATTEQQVTDHCVLTPLSGAGSDTFAGYRGVLVLRLDNCRPGASQAILAQLLVDRATAIVAGQRAAEAARALELRISNLEMALTSNREISTAMGVLMSSHRLTSEQAFDLLRRVSQRTHRKLREVAIDVTETGAIDLPDGIMLIAAMPQFPEARSHPFTRCEPRG